MVPGMQDGVAGQPCPSWTQYTYGLVHVALVDLHVVRRRKDRHVVGPQMWLASRRSRDWCALHRRDDGTSNRRSPSAVRRCGLGIAGNVFRKPCREFGMIGAKPIAGKASSWGGNNASK